LTETQQILVYPDDVNLPGENVNTKIKNTGALLLARNVVVLEANAEKTKCMSMFMGRMQEKVTT
jgi:hypothetical protein